MSRKTKLVTSFAFTAILLVGVVPADIVSNTESWTNASAGLNGWVGVGDSVQRVDTGGYDGGAYFESWRLYPHAAPSAQAAIGASSGVFVGDLEARYGEGQIGISFYGKNLTTDSGGHTPVTPPPAITLKIFQSTASWYLWELRLESFSFDWTKYEMTIDTNWTDEEAIAAGWTKTVDTASFASVINAVQAIRINPAGPLTEWGGETGISGIDEFTMQTVVPEPATISLLCAGGLLALARRRR